MKVQCIMCEKKQTFSNIGEMEKSAWKILAWVLPSGEPRVLCSHCKYGTPNEKAKNAKSI